MAEEGGVGESAIPNLDKKWNQIRIEQEKSTNDRWEEEWTRSKHL
jgi:hypothetical protein